MSDFGLEIPIDERLRALRSERSQFLVAAAACDRLVRCAQRVERAPLDDATSAVIEAAWADDALAAADGIQALATPVEDLLGREPSFGGPAPWLHTDAAIATLNLTRYLEERQPSHLGLAIGRVINSYEAVAEDMLGDEVVTDPGHVAKCMFDMVALEVGLQACSVAGLDDEQQPVDSASLRSLLVTRPSALLIAMLESHYDLGG